MIKFLRTKDTMAAVEDIIINAKKRLVIISPYLNISKIYFARLKTAAAKNMDITIIFRTGEVDAQKIEQLLSIEKIELRHMYNLHAKCYINETKAIVTSFNLLETSEKNWEMGMLINKQEDADIYNEIVEEAKTIFNESKEDFGKIDKNKFKKSVIVPTQSANGYCIRCVTGISFNPNQPLCKTCFTEWDYYGNTNYPEKYCHCCAIPRTTTINEPFCIKCNKIHGDLLIYKRGIGI